MTYTTAEAAERLGVKIETLRGHIKRHGLGVKRGRDVFLSEHDIDYIRSRLGKRGQPGHMR